MANKISKAEIYSIISDMIQGVYVSDRKTPFPIKIAVTEPQLGTRIPHLILENRTVMPVSENYISNQILNFTRDSCPWLKLTKRESNEATEYVKGVLKPIPIPLYVAQHSEPGFAYRRLPFDIDAKNARLEDCPTWNETLSRMSNADAFCCRIASIFDEKADRKTAIYLWGPKDSGKSCLVQTIAYLCGQTKDFPGCFTTLSNDDLKSPFYKAALIGKRVLVINESTSWFINTEEFKALTGDSYHSINDKGRPIYQSPINVLVYFVSNNPPEISGEDEAIIERVVDCKLNSFLGEKVPEEVLLAKLRLELPAFLGICERIYKPYLGGGRIPSEKESLYQSMEDMEAPATDFFERHFVADPAENIGSSELYTYCAEQRLSSRTYSEWFKIWERRYGIRRKRGTYRLLHDSKSVIRPNYVEGMRLRGWHEKPHFSADHTQKQDVRPVRGTNESFTHQLSKSD